MSTAPVAAPKRAAAALPKGVAEVFGVFEREQGRRVRCWAGNGDGWLLAYPAGADDGAPGPRSVPVPAGAERRMCLEVAGDSLSDNGSARFLAEAVGHLLRQEAEARSLAEQLAAGYEEITLLYSISEILGAVISLDKAAGIILSEVVGALGVRRASLWVYDAVREQLDLAAAVGGEGQTGPIPVEDRCSVTAEVFRGQRPVILEPGDVYPRGDCPPMPATREYFLSVPVSYTPPQGEARAVGVINLVGRDSGNPFLAGDLKLISAIASQIGAAVENNRLVAESLRRERLAREMELAHDLQLKLLPSLEDFTGYAEVAGRCVQAESVGGDFYHLFRLSRGRLGVMIGDVSSHGFGAALIMALTMSAVAIHASEGDPPAEVLRRVHRAMIEELESTEMYLTLFYAVIDPEKGEMAYANAGHPYAFRIPADGPAERLAATNPPFGIVDLDSYGEATAPWVAGEDLLMLFTDGLSDGLSTEAADGDEVLLDEVLARRNAPAEELIEHVFSLDGGDGRAPPDDRTAILVRI